MGYSEYIVCLTDIIKNNGACSNYTCSTCPIKHACILGYKKEFNINVPLRTLRKDTAIKLILEHISSDELFEILIGSEG